jgi:hypothetical protein
MSPRWDTPYAWLEEAAQRWDAARLQAELLNLARLLDSDQLQDEYQRDMDADGYFAPEGGAR